MTFTEAALEVLKREGKPLHFKELTERAMTKKLLTFVGRTPEVTMQTQLTAAVKKAPGNPFVRVKPGVFGLLRYPEMPPEEKVRDEAPSRADDKAGDKKEVRKDDKKPPERRAAEVGDEERGRRRRRRGGRGRGGAKEAEAPRVGRPEGASESESPVLGSSREGSDQDEPDEPAAGGLSAEARAAALAETGVLEGDDEMTSADDDADADEHADADKRSVSSNDEGVAVSGRAGENASDDGDDGEDDAEGDTEGDDNEGAFAAPQSAEGAKTAEGEDLARRRRRRRRRRRGGGAEGDLPAGDGPEGARGAETGGESPPEAARVQAVAQENGTETSPPATSEGGAPAESGTAAGQARRIMAPVEAAIEVLRGQPPGRGVHVRQIADSAIRRRLIHGEPNEAWRVIRTSLAAEPKDRLRNGMRPRVRAAGSGLYTLARRPPDAELEKAEQVFGEARRALRERTLAALEKRVAELPPGAFEALARVLLQREGFGPTTFVKRVEGTIYVEALRGRGSRPSKCLIGLRPGGSSAGRRTIGELRAGIRARGQDEGLLMLAGRLAEDAISEWKQSGSPLEIADGAAMAETCARHGVGVLPAVLNVDFVDADFFSELAEG